MLGWSALALLLVPALLDIVMRSLGLGVLGAGFLTSAALFGAPATGLLAGYLRVAGFRYKKDIPKDDIVLGFTAPRWGSADVELELHGGKNLSVRVGSVAEGDALLAQLGVDPAKRRGKIPLSSEAKRVFTGVALTFLATMVVMFSTFTLIAAFNLPKPLPLVGIIALFVAWVAGPWLLIAASRPPTLTVGADGVLVELAFGRKRFIPLGDIESAVAFGPTLKLVLRNDEILEYGGVWSTSVDRAAAAAKRIQDAVDARTADSPPSAKLALLNRRDRPISVWREALQGLVREGDYRTPSLSIGDLHEVLDSEVASVEQKLAAAMVLRAADPEAARAKVRLAASRVAHERVRIALNSTLEAEDDEAIEEALRATQEKQEA